jgi:protein required for attachment to host cells
MKKPVTWIVVADHQRARVYEGAAPDVRPVAGMEFATHLHASRDIVSDKPGRGFAGRSGPQYGVEPKTDPHRDEARHFIAGIVARLDEAHGRGAFDRLVLVAPPRALGEFRKALPDAVRAKVTAEIAEDLTKEPTASLARHLARHLTA